MDEIIKQTILLRKKDPILNSLFISFITLLIITIFAMIH
jgi:hypothetical protein